MSHVLRDGDVITNPSSKVGALTLSQNLYNYDAGGFSPMAMWQTQPAIRTVVDFIVDSIALVPFDPYQRTDAGRVKDRTSPIAQALRAPAPRVGQKRWVAQLQRDMLLYGRWAFFTNEDRDGRLRFVRLPAHAFSLVADEYGRYTDVVIYGSGRNGTPGKVIRPLGDDIVFDINDPGNGAEYRAGVTPVSVLEGLARETEGLEAYRTQLFHNSAMVPAVIERPAEAKKWSDDAWRRFKEEFATYRAGGGNAGGTPLLEDGMKLKPVEVFNPRDAEYVEVRKLALVEAAQALHVPPELVGAQAGTHSNIVALREQLYVDVLGAALGYFEDALNAGLEPWLGDAGYVEANLETRLRATFTERVKAYQAAGGGPWMTREEIRNRENLEFIEGTEELIVPMNVTEGGLASPLDTGQTNEPDPLDPLKGRRMKALPKAAAPERPRAKAAREELAEALKAEHARLGKSFDRKLGISTIADFQAEHPAAKATATPVAIDREYVEYEVRSLSKSLTRRLRAVAEAGSKDVLSELGISDFAGWDAARQKAWVEKAAESWARASVHGWYVDTINEAIAEHPGEWAMKVRETMKSPAATNAASLKMGTQVESFGRQDGARAAGASTKTWKTTSLFPRDSHKALSGTTVPVDATFSNGCRYPGDASAPSSETDNCQCVLSYSKEAS